MNVERGTYCLLVIPVDTAQRLALGVYYLGRGGMERKARALHLKERNRGQGKARQSSQEVEKRRRVIRADQSRAAEEMGLGLGPKRQDFERRASF